MADNVEYILSLKDLFTRTLRKAGDETESFDKKASSAFDRLKNIAGIAIAGGALTAFGVDVVQTGAKFDSYEAGLATLLKSTTKAKDVFNLIKEDAKATPFDTESLVIANRALISAGSSAEEARKDVMNFSNAIAATGGSSDNLKSMAVNMNQIKSLGKATAGDIRQFVYQGIPIYQLLAEATGKSVKEVQNMEISYEVLSGAFEKAAKSGGMFAGALEGQSKGMAGQLSNLGESIIFLKVELYDALKPAIISIVEAMSGMVEKMKSVVTWGRQNAGIVKTIGVFLGILTAGIIAYNAYVVISTQLTALWTTAQAILNGTMALNPIGLIITGIAALGAAIYYLWNNFEGFRGTVMGVWEVLKTLAVLVKDVIVNTFLGLGKLIEGVFTLDADKIKEGALQAGKAILEATPVGFAMANGEKLAGAFSKGYAGGVQDFKEEKLKNTLSELGGGLTPGGATPPGGGGGLPPLPPSPPGAGLASAVNGVASGRAASITVNIDSLIKNNTNQITNIKNERDLTNFMDLLQRSLMTVVNDVNVLGG